MQHGSILLKCVLSEPLSILIKFLDPCNDISLLIKCYTYHYLHDYLIHRAQISMHLIVIVFSRSH